MDSRDIRAAVEEVIRIFISAVQTRNMYGKDHNLARDAINKLYSKLTEALSGRDEITIGVIGDEIAFEKEPFYEISENVGNFILRLKKMKTEKISFLKGVEKKELTVLIDLLAGDARSFDKAAGVEKALESQDVTHILMGALGAHEKDGKDEAKIDIEMAAKASFQHGIDFLKKASDDIRNNKPIDITAARFVVSKIVRNLLKNAHSLLILTALKKRDEYTFSHSINVAIFTMVQAEALGLQEDLLTDIGIAALLHDTGKLAVATAIIQKSETLDQEETEKMQSHPIEGAEILLETPEMSLIAALSSFEHHVKYDRQGYPQKIYGDKINLASMMITVADVYDALRSKRSYHEPLPSEKVYEEMIKLSGKYFHPDLLDVFFSRIGMYPPGTLVELDNNAIGLVVKESVLDMKRPHVEMLYNSKGEKEKEPYIINLLEKDEGAKGYKWTIVRSMPLSDKYEIPNKYKSDQ